MKYKGNTITENGKKAAPIMVPSFVPKHLPRTVLLFFLNDSERKANLCNYHTGQLYQVFEK